MIRKANNVIDQIPIVYLKHVYRLLFGDDYSVRITHRQLKDDMEETLDDPHVDLEDGSMYVKALELAVEESNYTAFQFIKANMNYSDSTEDNKTYIKNVFFDTKIFSISDLQDALAKNGYKFKYRNRGTSKNQYEVKNFDRDQLWKIFTNTLTDADVNYEKEFTQATKKDLGPKYKACSVFCIKLNSMLPSLNGFKGTDEVTISEIKELYEDLADKIHIITTGRLGMDLVMNELKTQFQKLYRNLHLILDRWVPSTISGGNIKKGSSTSNSNPLYFYTPVQVRTTMPYKL